MHKTGIEDYYIIKDNKKMRYGYTTGTCAAAAAKAAALMFFSGQPVAHVTLLTPKGIELDLIPEEIEFDREDQRPGEVVSDEAACGGEASDRAVSGMAELFHGVRRVSCAIRKDAGDDPDVTDGILIFAEVRPGRLPEGSGAVVYAPSEEAEETLSPSEGSGKNSYGEDPVLSPGQILRIFLDGGKGVGRVTREGMQQKVGEAAINPIPRQMIFREVAGVCRDFEYRGDISVMISIPRGEELAGKTFNPRLGIEGGISVLGTSGIVVPMSKTALIASIRLEMQMLFHQGHEYLLVTPGNYGETFTKEQMTVDLSASLKCSNFVGETLDMAVNMGVKGILFVAHIGKFIKVAGGIMNTHSKDADCRAELMAAFALRAGADRDTAMKILDSITTDEALEIMEEAGVRERAARLMLERIRYYLQHRIGGAIRTEAILFSGKFGYLGQTEGAQEMLDHYF